jgi:hypothetical protein
MTRDEEKANPYESPKIGDNELPRMTDFGLKEKCAQLLARRSEKAESPWYYVRRDLRRQVVLVAAYVSVCGALWFFGFQLLSATFAGFFIGRTVRDIRWWRTLSKEWPITREVLDWQRIEEIARQ